MEEGEGGESTAMRRCMPMNNKGGIFGVLVSLHKDYPLPFPLFTELSLVAYFQLSLDVPTDPSVCTTATARKCTRLYTAPKKWEWKALETLSQAHTVQCTHTRRKSLQIRRGREEDL